MNPVISALLLQVEQMGISLAEECVLRFLGNLSKGMSLADAAQDLAMWAAEQQALALDKAAGAL